MPRGRSLLIAAVVALAVWSGVESALLWSAGIMPPDADPPFPIALAVILPLPLLLAPRAPALAALGVVALVLLRAALGARAYTGTADTVVLLIALFLGAAGARGRAPLTGLLPALVAAGGTVLLHRLGVGYHGILTTQPIVGALAGITGAVGAGYALRDRRLEARRLEHELGELRAQGAARVDALLVGERGKLAAELEDAVALLLRRARPRAARAVGAPPGQLAADMRAVGAAAQAAMTEVRRALQLLRAPEPPAGADLGATVAAGRRTRWRHALGWAAPVLAVAVFGVVDHALVPPLPYHWAFTGGFVVDAPGLGPVSPYVTAVLCALPLLARGRATLLAALAVCVLLVARMQIGDLTTLHLNQYLVIEATAFMCVAHARSVREGVAIGVVTALTALLVFSMEQADYLAITYTFTVLMPLTAMLGGLLVRGRVASARAARAAREALDREHEALARERLAAERLQAARDLHDVVGHAVSIVSLQAGAAVACAPVDVEQARAAARVVVGVIADAERDLARLRALLGATAPPAAPPSLPELVDGVRAAGLPVTLDQRVPDDELPFALSLTAFRVVQEALTNVRKHAGLAPTRVTVAVAGGTLVVEVVDEGGQGGARGDGGRGLLGMRERAALYAGRVEAGPIEGGGWRVRAELPLHADPLTGPASEALRSRRSVEGIRGAAS